MQNSMAAIDHNKAPIFSIEGYAVLELLGSGAFGSVYKVKMADCTGLEHFSVCVCIVVCRSASKTQTCFTL